MTRPLAVAAARGILEAAAIAAIGAAYLWLGSADLGDSWAHWAPVGMLVLRTLEGWADENIDTTKERGTLGRTLAGTTVRKRGEQLHAEDA